MDLTKQASINNLFIHTYKTTMNRYNINTLYLIQQLDEFEKKKH